MTELIIRYTGINYILRSAYIILPFMMIAFFYFFLIYKFFNESKKS